MHRDTQDNEIRHNAKHRIRVPRRHKVVTMAFISFMPSLVDRHALEDAGDSGGDGEEAYEGEDEVDEEAVDPVGHDAEVEEQDGHFVEGNGDFVG
jgi:hypothetical protein